MHINSFPVVNRLLLDDTTLTLIIIVLPFTMSDIKPKTIFIMFTNDLDLLPLSNSELGVGVVDSLHPMIPPLQM